MTKVWIRCFVLPSKLLRGENFYRIRRYDGSILEGNGGQHSVIPTFSTILKEDQKSNGLLYVWGAVAAELLNESDDRLVVAMPDKQIVEVKNSHVVSRANDESENA